jgi:hypothetical protein
VSKPLKSYSTVTKKEEGIHKSDSLYTAYCESIADLTIHWLHCSSTDTHRSTDSNHHLSTADLTVIRQIHQHTAQLRTHLSQDLLTQTHHQNACISFTICTRSESSSRFLQHKMTNLIVLVVLVPLLHPPLSCSTT